MIFDNQALFSKAQAIVATAVSTNVIDTGLNGTVFGQSGPFGKDVGKGNAVPFLLQCVETFNNLTSLKVELQTAVDAAFTSPKNIDLGTYLAAVLVAGWQLPFTELPSGINAQFMRLNYTVTGTAPTTGKLTAGIVADVQTDAV